MKKLNLNTMLVVTTLVVAILFASCGKKMDPLRGNLFNVNPSPLELVGTKVPVTIDGRIPQDWFDKNTTVVITPVLRYPGGEAVGTSQTYQGENVMGNGITIVKNTGGTVSLRSSFDYVPAMKQSELFLRFQVSKKDKRIDGFPDVKVADGVMSTAALASAATTNPSMAADAFQKIIKETHDADIMFLIQRAELRSGELDSRNVHAWKEIVKEAETNNRKKVDVEVSAYASPDGGYKLNEKLAGQRETNTSDYLKREFRKDAIDAEVNAKYTAQDWEGFQKLVQASSLQDKDLVLRVLSMYSDPEVREREIKNISRVYSDLAETILPQLRRSRLIANVEIVGKTDQELKDAVASSSMQELSLEELLYAATLLPASQQESIYTHTTRQFPNDYRGWNNLGAIQYAKGDVAKATQNFNKAKGLSTNAVEASANLGLVALEKGDMAQAEQLLGSASGASSLNEALGLLYIRKGEYSKAEQAFMDTKSNNAALSQVLTKNYSKAQRTINDIVDKNATTHYIAAIIAARTNNQSGVVGNLKSAIDKGISLQDISLDGEFAKYLSNPDVQRMLTSK